MEQIIVKNEILHDMQCPYLGLYGDKEMQLDELVNWAKRYRCCQRCRRIALIHDGIADIENYEIYYKFFDRNRVSLDVLKELFIQNKAKVKLRDDYIEMHCNQDTWRISRKLENRKAKLFHNNYTKTFFGRRVSDSEFHEQFLQKKTVEGALKYILEYDYDLFHR